MPNGSRPWAGEGPWPETRSTHGSSLAGWVCQETLAHATGNSGQQTVAMVAGRQGWEGVRVADEPPQCSSNLGRKHLPGEEVWPGP